MANCSDTCYCRNLICAITFLTIGIVFIVAGGVIAAVGFGTRPKDMFDTQNLSMRVVGLIFAGAGILPIVMGVMFTLFYCANKRGKLPGQKKDFKNDVELNVITKQGLGRNEYPYPSEGGPLIYKPGSIPDDSLVKYEDYEKEDHYAVPLDRSGQSLNNGEVETSRSYSEVKASEEGRAKTRTKTTTTTTTTKIYKTEMMGSNTGSGSSGITFHNESLPQVKTKVPKKNQMNTNDSATGSMSSEIPSFNEGDVPLHQKTKRPKKHKKREAVDVPPPPADDVFDDMDEPLPIGRYCSERSSSTEAQKRMPKPRHSPTSPSFEDGSDEPMAAVYGRVNKKRSNKL